MKKVCIELSRCYIKGDLKKLVEQRNETHIYSNYGCPIISVNENELVNIKQLCKKNKCRFSLVE